MGVKFALEIPVPLLEKLEPEVDFHFAIATTAVTNGEYFDYYQDYTQNRHSQLQRGTFKFLMLDNGTHESYSTAKESKPMEPKELVRLCKALRPDIAWAPDIIGDQYLTNKLAEEFRRLLEDEAWAGQIGFIPQGRTAEEIADSWKGLGYKYDWIGLSFHNDRDRVISMMGQRIADFSIHMLGLSNLKEIKTWPRAVRSVDTSKPIKAARLGLSLRECKRGMGLLEPTATVDPRYEPLLYANIKELRSACREFDL